MAAQQFNYLRIVENKEYRNDGSLFYEETFAFLDKKEVEDDQSIWENVRTDESGSYFIRINKCTKYKKDGSVQWQLEYEENGKVK